jgi:hypothetical protein
MDRQRWCFLGRFCKKSGANGSLGAAGGRRSPLCFKSFFDLSVFQEQAIRIPNERADYIHPLPFLELLQVNRRAANGFEVAAVF